MLERRTWEEFKDSKLLWWINRSLHLFGWAIAYDVDDTGEIVSVYPARCSFRGFSESSEESGFEGLTSHLNDNMPLLMKDTLEYDDDSK